MSEALQSIKDNHDALVRSEQKLLKSLIIADKRIEQLEDIIAELTKYFTSGNEIPVERATILTRDFLKITKQEPQS